MIQGEHPRVGGPVEGNCRHCICRVCNMKNCRWRTHWQRCTFCWNRTVQGKIRPTLGCDYFTPVYPANHVYRIIKVRRKCDRIGEILKIVKEILAAF